LTQKAENYTEAKAGVAGGTTTYMELLTTVPQPVIIQLLEEKYTRASQVSLRIIPFSSERQMTIWRKP
jgi:dihydroorotase